MKPALLTMLGMQHRMNVRVHARWIEQRFEWHRAIWVECAELLGHFGYKWWKSKLTDWAQVRLEVVDVWHFGMSSLLQSGGEIDAVADRVIADVGGRRPRRIAVPDAAEALAANVIGTRRFSVPLFWDLMHAVGMGFDTLFREYVGKNVLNFFRQDHGYQDGSYLKNWGGREDNEHLAELVASLDASAEGYADALYQALARRYAECAGAECAAGGPS